MLETFLFALLCGVLIIYLPGFLINKALRFDALLSFVMAPVSSCACILILGIILYYIPIQLNGIVLLISAIAIALIVFIISAIRASSKWKSAATVTSTGMLAKIPKSMTMFSMMGLQSKPSNWILMLLYVVVAALVAIFMFSANVENVVSLTSSFAQDETFAIITNMSENSIFSVLIFSISPETSEIVFSSFNLWQVLLAVVASITGINHVICASAILVIFLVLVLPIGVFGFLGIVFHRNRLVVVVGSALSVSFAPFPWHMVLFPSQIPFVIAFSCVAYVFIAVLGFTIQGSKAQSKLAYMFLLICTVICIIASYASSLFGIVVLCMPYLVSRYFCWVNDFGKFKKPVLAKIVGVLCAISVCFLVWLIFNSLPFATVQPGSPAPSYENVLHSFVDVAILNLIPTAGSQILLGLMTVLGAIILIFKKGYRWLLTTWIAAVCMFLVFALLPGSALSYAFGFWYVLPIVLATLICIASIPLAAVFAETVIRSVSVALISINLNKSRGLLVLVGVLFMVAFLCVNFAVDNMVLLDNHNFNNALDFVQDRIDAISLIT